ncbi:MAG: DUF86 domain-containing protein [Candidatus Riflebacteria bacterium]|nr:DUF86 domain-containing protein [Candidatus Riflebacteria bacterium]
MKDPMVYLDHILEAIGWIEEDTRSGKDVFLHSRLVRDAVLRSLQTLAESTQRLPDGMKERHPEIDWSGIASFRNVLVHDYLGLDVEVAWEVIQRDLPHLKLAVQALRADAPKLEN